MNNEVLHPAATTTNADKSVTTLWFENTEGARWASSGPIAGTIHVDVHTDRHDGTTQGRVTLIAQGDMAGNQRQTMVLSGDLEDLQATVEALALQAEAAARTVNQLRGMQRPQLAVAPAS